MVKRRRHGGVNVGQDNEVDGRRQVYGRRQIQEDFAGAIRTRMAVGGTLHGIDNKYFINMDQTAVYFEMKSNTTVDTVGVKTVSIRDSASNSKRATVVLAVAADGTKLPPFVVFKGK